MANGQIPSGGAPLFLGDFATPTAAIGQKMTERLIDKNKADQTRRGKERTAMLKALDFSAVEGLSKKVSMEHLDQNNALTDKWAERWLNQGKKLTDRDYLELEQDKRTLQQDVANKKHNVAQIANVQNQLKTNPYNWEPGSLDRLNEFIKEGNVGRDASQILVPQYDALGALQSRLKGAKFDQTETIKYDEKSGKNIVSKSNQKSVDDTVRNYIQNDPKIQGMLNSQDPNIRNRALADINSYREFNTKEDVIQRTPTVGESKERAMAGAVDKYKDDAQAQMLLAKDVPMSDIPVAKAINNSLHKLIQGDAATIESLHGTSKWGFIDAAERRPNGDIKIYGKADKNGQRPEKTFHVSEAKTDAQKRMLMETMIDIGIPDMITGKEQPKNILNTIVPSGWDVEPGKTGFPIMYKERLQDVVEGEKLTTNNATTLLSDLYPEKEKAKERTWMKSTKLAKDGITWNKKEYIWKEDGSKKLLNDVAEEFGYETPFPELTDSEDVVPEELPVVTNQEEYEKLESGTKYTFEGKTLTKE